MVHIRKSVKCLTVDNKLTIKKVCLMFVFNLEVEIYMCLELFFSKGKMQSISSLCERVFKNMQETLNCTKNSGSPSYFWFPEWLNRTWLCKLIFKWEKWCSQRHRAVSQPSCMSIVLFSHLIWLHLQSWSNITSGDKGQGIWVLGLADLYLSVYWSLGVTLE